MKHIGAINHFKNNIDIQNNWNNFYDTCQENRYDNFFDNDYELGLHAVMSYLAKNEGKKNLKIEDLSQIEAE